VLWVLAQSRGAGGMTSRKPQTQKERTDDKQTEPIPDGYHTATPYLIVKGAAQAIEFYKKAFGATECCAWRNLVARSATLKSR